AERLEQVVVMAVDQRDVGVGATQHPDHPKAAEASADHDDAVSAEGHAPNLLGLNRHRTGMAQAGFPELQSSASPFGPLTCHPSPAIDATAGRRSGSAPRSRLCCC